jgi:MFS family permease
MTTFFYGTAAVVPLLVSETYPTRIRATGNAFTASFAIALGLGIFPLLTGIMVPILGWNTTFGFFVLIPLALSGLLLLFTRNYRSGQELEAVVL